MECGKMEFGEFEAQVNGIFDDFHRFAPVNGGLRPGNRVDAAHFADEAVTWMKHNHFTEAEMNRFEEEYGSAHVLEVGTVYAGCYCFGENDKSYFIMEMGCGYD